MAEPGYDRSDNMFDRFGRAIFGSERDVAPGRPPFSSGNSGGAQAAQAPSREEPPTALDTGRGPGGRPVERYGAREIEYPNPLPPNWRAELPPGAAVEPTPTPDPTDPGNRIINRNPDRMTEPDHIEATPRDPALVKSDDEASFRPGPLPKGTPTSRPGGGGAGGRGTGGRKLLGDQTRVEAYDPTLDRMDPRNIGVIDTEGPNQGRVNQQVYAASPMVHPEAYPAGQTLTTNALKGATEFVSDQFHQNTPDQHTGEGYAALTKGAVGAPDDDTMRSVFAVVDPNGQLDYKHRMELATKTGYDWYMHNGEPEKAKKFAADALQYGNKQAQAYGDQALKDLKAGDRPSALAHLTTGYGWLPDGYHADPSRDGKTLEIHDGKGKTVQTIPLDDKMIENLATGMATGTLYWDTVQHRAGVQQPFRPQQATPPTQAIAAQPPQPSPSAQSPPQQAGRPLPAGTPPVVTPPGRPAVPPPQPLPAPAIAGPQFNTPQQVAAQPAAAPAGPAPPPAAPAPAISTAPPSQLQPAPVTGPVQPSTTKRPIVAGEPPAIETKPPATGEQKSPDQKPQVTLVRPGNDPDAVPTAITDGKNTQPLEPHRYTSSQETAEVTRARNAISDADALLKKQYNDYILPTKGKLNPKNKADAPAIALLNGYEKQAIKDRDETIARHNEVLRRNEHRQDRQDRIEEEQLKPEVLTGTNLDEAQKKINAEFQAVTDGKDKHPKYISSPLRYATDAQKAEMQRVALELKAYNRNISPEEAARYTIEVTSHVGTDQKGLNGQSGAKGSRFNVTNQDLLGRPVIVVNDGDKPVYLSVPTNVLNTIQRFKQGSYQVEADKAKEVKVKADQERAAQQLRQAQIARGERPDLLGVLTPQVTRQSEETRQKDPVGAAVTEIAGAFAQYGTPVGWSYLTAKYGVDAAREAFRRLGRKPPEVEPPPQESGQGRFVMTPPGT